MLSKAPDGAPPPDENIGLLIKLFILFEFYWILYYCAFAFTIVPAILFAFGEFSSELEPIGIFYLYSLSSIFAVSIILIFLSAPNY